MQKELLIAIKLHVLATVPSIKSVRLYNSQELNEEKENAFLYPVVFVEFQNSTYHNLSKGVQQFEMVVVTHLGMESYKDEELSILDLKQELYNSLMKFGGASLVNGYFSMMTRTGERQSYNHNNTQYYETDYLVQGKDYLSDNRPTIVATASVVLVGATGSLPITLLTGTYSI